MRRFLGVVALLISSSLAFANTEADLNNIVVKMQNAILSQNKNAYLELVDVSDPVFALEHSRWVEDWVNHPVKQLELKFVLLEESLYSAIGTLTWKYQNRDGLRIVANYPVVFHALEHGWLYAGEYWLELKTANTSVKYAPGLQNQANSVLERLPEIGAHVANSLEFQSQATTIVKIYDSKEAITQSVGLGWSLFTGWNEPGEAIKVSSEYGINISSSVLAHEITHNYAFELFGASSFPWWLDEGLAEYVASKYWNSSQIESIQRKVADWAKMGELQAWDNMAVLDETPTSLWKFVYAQGFAFVRYLTDIYGQKSRNQWLNQISSGRSLTEAAQVQFGKTFGQLDQDFLLWLKVGNSTYLSNLGTSLLQRSSPLPTAHCTITTASLGFSGMLEISPVLGLAPQTL
jgi:hypothetical protein